MGDEYYKKSKILYKGSTGAKESKSSCNSGH